jgi:hypothetical protein
LPDYNQIWDFSTDFNKNFAVSNFTEIRPVEAALIHADRRTDIEKQIGAFYNYAGAPENYFSIFLPLVSVVWQRHVGSRC